MADQFISKYTSTEIEAMLDKIHQDMQTIQFTQTEINTLLTKINNATIPTKVSDLTNDSGFITTTVANLTNYYKKTETYSKSEIDTLVSNAASGGFIPVETLPTTNISTKGIYLVPSATTKTKNIYDEYINLDGTVNGWEMIGDTKINLADYVTVTALNTALANYVTATALNTALADYVTVTSLSTTLGSYYTKAEIDAMIAELHPTTPEEPTPSEPEDPTEPDPTDPETPNNDDPDNSDPNSEEPGDGE